MTRVLVFTALMSLSGYAEVLFQSDLENVTPSCWSAKHIHNDGTCDGLFITKDTVINLSKPGDPVHSGNRALTMTIRHDEDQGLAVAKIPPTRHVFTSYWDYYSPGFDFGSFMKTHRFSGWVAGKDYSEWDIIVYIAGGGAQCDINNGTWQNIGRNGGPTDWGVWGAAINPPRGKWAHQETELWLNDPGQSNGIVRMWVDGVLLREKTGLNIVGSNTTGVTDVGFGGWYSNSSGGQACANPGVVSKRFLDDLQVCKDTRCVDFSSSPLPVTPPVVVLPPVDTAPKCTPTTITIHDTIPRVPLPPVVVKHDSIIYVDRPYPVPGPVVTKTDTLPRACPAPVICPVPILATCVNPPPACPAIPACPAYPVQWILKPTVSE